MLKHLIQGQGHKGVVLNPILAIYALCCIIE